MSKVEEIEAAIESLSEEEYLHLRKWFSEFNPSPPCPSP